MNPTGMARRRLEAALADAIDYVCDKRHQKQDETQLLRTRQSRHAFNHLGAFFECSFCGLCDL